ncbi:spore coat protein [Domibacillus iocasae]|nr:spore coat protein [Domibacillus iocasae]
MTANYLTEFKMQLANIQDSTCEVYIWRLSVALCKIRLLDLLPFYEKAPIPMMHSDNHEMYSSKLIGVDLTAFYVGKLLIFAKNALCNYAGAITETATSSLRERFQSQLQKAIKLHANVFNFMLERSYYPAYHLDQLLANDLKNANAPLKR